MPHIKLHNNNPLIIAFENKRIKLGYTTTTSAVMKAIHLFMEMEPPVYLTDDKEVDLDDHVHPSIAVKDACDLCGLCHGTGVKDE